MYFIASSLWEWSTLRQTGRAEIDNRAASPGRCDCEHAFRCAFSSEIAESPVSTANGVGSAPAGVITPPHNLEAEQSVLGAILLSDRSLYALVIEEGLKPEDFYRARHGTIYEAMLALYNESEPVDPLTVIDRLKQ